VTAAGFAADPRIAPGEKVVPHVIVKLWPGPSEPQKARLAAAITREVTAVLGLGEESVSVAVEEVEPGDWMRAVYRPDIAGRPELLYKRPGYDPSELP
jgi:4-oxalocrotonate tautomerase